MFKRISFLLAAALLSAVPFAHAADYSVDPVHSSAIFRIRHMNTSWTYGRIDEPAGTVAFDPAAPEKTTFQITLKTENIDTHAAARDNHLKSPAFFNAKENPTLTFQSTAVKKTDDTHLEVTGDLTIHGVTKSITIPIEISGTGQGPTGKPIAGFEATFNIKRSDYGMGQMLEMVGDDVRIIIALEVDQK